MGDRRGGGPRRLIYAHEFSWDREHDPVWGRLQKIYGFYKVPENLASVHGRGRVTGRGPENTHCNNIGPEHRKQIYPILKRSVWPPHSGAGSHGAAAPPNWPA